MTYLPELRDSLVRAAAREYGHAPGARAVARVPSAGRARAVLTRHAGLLPVALALCVTAAVAIIAVTALRPAPSRPGPSSSSHQLLTSILGVLRAPSTAEDRALARNAEFVNPAYISSRTSVRFLTTAPWGDRLFIFGSTDGTSTPGWSAYAPLPSSGAREGELVGLPRHPNHVNGNGAPVPDAYIPLTVADVEAGRATFIWPGGQPAAPAANTTIEPLFGPKEEIAVVVPDGVATVEFVLPRQPMAIVGAPVYPRVEHLTVAVKHNVAVAEIDRKCCYLPTAQLARQRFRDNQTTQASGPMIWFAADGHVIKRIGDVAAAGRVIALPRPGPETAASRAAERNPSTPNPVSVTPLLGGPRTLFHVHFKALLTGADYGYDLVRLTSGACHIPGLAVRTGQPIGGGPLTAGYEPNVVRGEPWNGPLVLGSPEPPLCAGTYRLSATVVSRGVFGGYGPNYSARSKPFGSTTFTVR